MFDNTSSLTQQFAGRHIDPNGHLILIHDVLYSMPHKGRCYIMASYLFSPASTYLQFHYFQITMVKQELWNEMKKKSLEINIREYRKGIKKWTIQRNCQHRVYKTKTNKAKTQHNMC